MIQLKVNGEERSFDGDPDLPLLWYLRDVLGLTGTKFGCGMALCGACTVHQDGKAIRSCVTSMSALAGKEITTIEAISKERTASRPAEVDRVQRAAMRLLPVRDRSCRPFPC